MSISADLQTKDLQHKLEILSSGLGGIFQELLQGVGDEMSQQAKQNAPVRSGRLRDSIKFLFDKKDNIGALTTRKTLNKSTIWYGRQVEQNRTITAKEGKYLMFKIDGEWKKMKQVTVKGKPFASPVFDDYFGTGDKGYRLLQEALMNKINEELK